MPTFGDFETIGEPISVSEQSGHVSTVWRARKSGSDSDPTHAVKCFAPHRRKSGEGEAEEALDKDRGLEFLEGVKQLKKAHNEGGRCLCPIHAFGFSDEGAWFVTDFYPRGTLKAWIARRGSVDNAALRQVVFCIVTGCLVLKRSRGYSHGNLKAANVFLVGKPQPLRKTPLALADAYPSAPLQLARLVGEEKRTVDDLLHQVMEVQDLRALGELLLQLVEGRLVSSAYDYNYPIAASPAWERLGRDAERWRDLTNRLLDPRLSLEKLSLESLAGEFRPGVATEKMPLILGAAAGVLVLGGGIFLFASMVSKAGGKKFEAHFQAATNAFAASNWALAQREIDSALKRKADDPGALDWRTKISTRLDQEYAAAIQSGKQALSLTNLDEATRWSKRAAELKPTGQDALDLQADIASLNKQRELEQTQRQTAQQQAAEALRKGMESASTFERAGDFTNALAAYEALLRTNANSSQLEAKVRELTPKATEQRRQAAEQARLQQAAAADLRKAMESAAEFERAGNFTNALAAYQAISGVNANNPQVVQKIRELTPKANEQRQQAAEQARLQQLAAASLRNTMDAAASLERAGNFTNALAMYQAILRTNANNAPAEAKIRELTPKANDQRQQAAEQARLQRLAAESLRQAMESAAGFESAGDYTNALALYRAIQITNAGNAQLEARIREVGPKATEQQKQAAEQARLQQLAAEGLRKAMNGAAAFERAGNYTNALAAYQAILTTNAGNTQVEAKVRELKARAAEQERLTVEQARLQQLAAEALRKALAAAAALELAGDYTNALASYRAIQKTNADNPELANKIRLLAPKAAEQERLALERIRQQNYQTAMAAAKQALEEAETALGATNYVLVDEKIKAAQTQCAIARANGEAGPVDKLEQELKTLQSKVAAARSEGDYAGATRLMQAGKIKEALAICQGYQGNNRFDALQKSLAAMQSAYDSAVAGLNSGNYDFITGVESGGYDKNPLFAALMTRAREESRQLSALENLKTQNQWQELKDGLARLSADLLKKASFAALSQWVEENSPIKSLDKRLAVFKVWYGISQSSDSVVDWVTSRPAQAQPKGTPLPYYYNQLTKLREDYKSMGLLPQREKDLKLIESKMNLWDQ